MESISYVMCVEDNGASSPLDSVNFGFLYKLHTANVMNVFDPTMTISCTLTGHRLGC